ncbi:ATP-binding cassette sub-family C member 10-like [Bolinopsis microptera]|uniref:ATP-binding cassette sub-family C member 10-like n=1 Tax=Bolinopsis microptera TaxID=2820187 RepID=UPI003078DF5C
MGFIQAWVSLKRIQRFFDVPEDAPQRAALSLPYEEQNVIEVDNCSFYWTDPGMCCLVGLQFQVNKGELMVVMGKSGSGKSSLLLALSQELNIASGVLRLKEWKDGAGIVLQDCWIKSGSVREAVLDGCVFDLYWYEKVIYACALDNDIANFPLGDDTPAGANGSALSGGQRLRLSLARAVYKNKQVYLIDDIFAGLDSQVALHIFQHCINGLLAAKTRVICTHLKQFASSADTLLILADRHIKYIGLPHMHDMPYLDSVLLKDADEDSEKDEVEKERAQYEEPRQFGPIDVTVYKHYTKAAGAVLTLVVVISMFGMQGTSNLSDWWLSVWVKAVAHSAFSLIGTLVMTSYGLPYILLTIIPILVLYYFIQKYYITAVREVKRLYSMSQSPLFTHFEESVSGLVYIHSFRAYNSVQTMGVKYLEAFQRSCFCMSAATAWLGLRLQLLAAGVLLVASVIILTEIHYGVADAAVLGLALTYALTINSTLTALIFSMTEAEKEFVGAERVLQYTHDLPIEVEKEDIQSVDYNWPLFGAIQFSKVSVRYNGCNKRAVDELSFSVKPGEKLAIVGRTGAGKSSMFLALFRLVDLETGIIVIDGTNIHDISSKVLRQKLSILPQQPLVFTGTIRENIDPFNKYNDKDIIEALVKCQLSEFVNGEDHINRHISLKTLSSGESQLFSLARILLETSKILCLDEATSNVDMETDKIIQKIIRKEFKESTIITVAHRVETIIDYDKVLVMSRGKIVEEGNPKELLKERSSLFRNLAVKGGVVSSNIDDAIASSSKSQ